MSHLCNFCDKKFTTLQGLSSHYKVHKDLPLSTWLEHGPARSKIKLAYFKAQKEARHINKEVNTNESPPLSPDPLRAVMWVSPVCYAELPWLTQNPKGGPSEIKPPGRNSDFRANDWVQGPNEESESEETGSDSDVDVVSHKIHLWDLNLPATE